MVYHNAVEKKSACVCIASGWLPKVFLVCLTFNPILFSLLEVISKLKFRFLALIKISMIHILFFTYSHFPSGSYPYWNTWNSQKVQFSPTCCVYLFGHTWWCSGLFIPNCSGSLLVVLGEPYVVLEIDSGLELTICKASALILVLSLQPTRSMFPGLYLPIYPWITISYSTTFILLTFLFYYKTNISFGDPPRSLRHY